MNTATILYFICMTIITVFSVVSERISSSLVKKYKAYFDDEKQFNRAMFEYCMRDIVKRSIESEDYETAAKCKELLKQLEKC